MDSGGVLEASLEVFEGSRGACGPSLRRLRESWCDLGALGEVWKGFVLVLEGVGELSGRFGASWGGMAAVLGEIGAFLNSLGAILGGHGAFWGGVGGGLKGSWALSWEAGVGLGMVLGGCKAARRRIAIYCLASVFVSSYWVVLDIKTHRFPLCFAHILLKNDFLQQTQRLKKSLAPGRFSSYFWWHWGRFFGPFGPLWLLWGRFGLVLGQMFGQYLVVLSSCWVLVTALGELGMLYGGLETM